MSQEDGWAALNLQMPPRVPRTEYSAEGHWPLISAATGIDVAADAPEPLKRRAQRAFHRAWNYDLHWNTLISRQEFGAGIISNLAESQDGGISGFELRTGSNTVVGMGCGRFGDNAGFRTGRIAADGAG